MLPVRENREQIAGGVAVDADGDEIVDDEQIDVGELVQQFLVGDAVPAGDDEPSDEVVNPEVEDRVLALACPDGQRAGALGIPASGGRDDERVCRIGAPVMGA